MSVSIPIEDDEFTVVCDLDESNFVSPVNISPSQPSQSLADALSFDNANPPTLTNNGALSLSTCQPFNMKESVHGRMSFFFKATRSLLQSRNGSLLQLLQKAHDEDARGALVLVFHLRNCRGKGKNGGGKGERDLFRKCVEFYDNKEHRHLIEKNLASVVEFGRWDDLWFCPGGWDFFAQQLLKDYRTISNQQPQQPQQPQQLQQPTISLAAKWAPSSFSKNKCSTGKFRYVVESINKLLTTTHRDDVNLFTQVPIRAAEYRRMLSALRKHLKVVEKFMCQHQWEDIDFNHVPSNAMHLYGKAQRKTSFIARRKKTDPKPDKRGAFLRHCSERFTQWKQVLVKPQEEKSSEEKKVKVNATQLFPHELVASYLRSCRMPMNFFEDPKPVEVEPMDSLMEAQWQTIEQEMKSRGTLADALFVCDVSGSMNTTITGSSVRCLDVCIALGLLGCRCVTGPFANKVITFSNRPTFFDVPTDSLGSAITSITKMQWGTSTNLQAVFDLILSTAQKHNIDAKGMPKSLVILSDMEFNQACQSNSLTNYEVMQQKFSAAGYQMPVVVFWNLNTTSSQFPIPADTPKTLLMSGFSASLLDLITTQNIENINPWAVVKNVIDSPTYAAVQV